MITLRHKPLLPRRRTVEVPRAKLEIPVYRPFIPHCRFRYKFDREPIVSAVAFDAKSTADTLSGASVLTVTNANLTIGTISNGALIAILLLDNHLPASAAVTWNGVNCPLIGTINTASGNNGRVDLYGLVNPASGNHSLVATWLTTSCQAMLYGVSFSGVNQTGGTTSFAHFGSSATATAAPSVAITSATGNAVVGAFTTDAPGTISSTGNTNLFIDNGGANIDGAAEYASGAASVSVSGAVTAIGNCAIAGVDLVAAVAAGATPYNPWPQWAPVLAQ